MPAASWRCGDTTTTTSGRIHRLATGPRPKRAGRLSNLRAPRPARLPNPIQTNINPKDSRYERGTNGGQVSELPEPLNCACSAGDPDGNLWKSCVLLCLPDSCRCLLVAFLIFDGLLDKNFELCPPQALQASSFCHCTKFPNFTANP